MNQPGVMLDGKKKDFYSYWCVCMLSWSALKWLFYTLFYLTAIDVIIILFF
jgi:hypothetical protein